MKTVKARDAASLIIYEKKTTGTRILMGRRNRNSVFAPGLFAFPGGAQETSDRKLQREGGSAGMNLKHPRVSSLELLSLTAIRETWEETGLMLATPGDSFSGYAASSWGAFHHAGLVPAPQYLDYLGRAITPAESPRRYHARFFAAARERFRGELKSNGELLDLQWIPLDRAVLKPMFDVTAFMLEELARSLRRKRKTTPLLSYRGNHTLVRYEKIEDIR